MTPSFANFPASFDRSNPERIPSSLSDTDLSTRQTVQAMCRHVANAQKDPWFLTVARNLTSSRELADIISAVFLFCKASIRFKQDERSVWDLYRETDQVDFLIEPAAMVRMWPSCFGDCDEFTMFSLACLVALGVPCEIVTVAADRSRPGAWSHVYGQVIMPDGRRMALDCSPPGRYPGWEVPDYDVQRKQAWDLNGNPVQSTAEKDLRLHAYIPGRRRARRRGVADATDITEAPVSLDTSGNIVGDVTAGSWVNGTWVPSGSNVSTSGFNWNNLISNLSSIGSKLGTIALTPKGGYVATGPGGQTVVSNTGIPASFTGFATGASGNLLLWGGIALAVLLVAKAASK